MILEITSIVKEAGDKPEFSIIVVTRSLENKVIQRMIDSTAVISCSFEILIIFSVKPNDVNEILRNNLERNKSLVKIRAVLLKTDKGLTFGRNLGAILADSANLVFADDDIVLIEDISPMMDFLSITDCHAVQPLILRLSDPSIIDSAGDDLRRVNGVYHARIRGSGQKLSMFNNSLFVEQIASPRGAFMGIRKDTLFEVGGFDNSFCFNMDDVDIGWRMTLAGFKILFVPTIKVLHQGGRTTEISKGDRKVFEFWTVNFHALQLKVLSYPFWPLIIVRFLFFSVVYEVKQQNGRNEINLLGSGKDFLYICRMFVGRFANVVNHRNILAKFNYSGKGTFKILSQGKHILFDEKI